ncbi:MULTISPECIES: hypothetical protein [Leisingera]|uniref:hypothetical protein n=1 Tax=Leisingera TaxID=191028 RepID=UPI0012EC223A|nr:MULTISPECIES: hypothetical protein [Leisingera]MBY6059629.1 hypothetical protein [Leisingera daeponensis]
MPIERHQSLVTVAGVNSWKKAGKVFRVRYDLVKPGVNSGAPAYNCIYIVDGQEHVLVATNARPTGFIEERQISLWPGVLKKHHLQYGDGSMLVFNPEDQTLSTWMVGPDGKAELSTTGEDSTGADN